MSEKFSMSCPVQPGSPAAEQANVTDACKVSGSVPGLRRHVPRAHGLEKERSDELIDAALIASGRSDLITSKRRPHNAAIQAHWVETLPDSELAELQKKLGLFLKKDTPREDRIRLVKERADARGLTAVPATT